MNPKLNHLWVAWHLQKGLNELVETHEAELLYNIGLGRHKLPYDLGLRSLKMMTISASESESESSSDSTSSHAEEPWSLSLLWADRRFSSFQVLSNWWFLPEVHPLQKGFLNILERNW